MDESFLKIPKAITARKRGRYEKKIFPCCRLIKHKEFKQSELFKTPNTVVISGIKKGDGRQRAFFLHSLKHGYNKYHFEGCLDRYLKPG